MPGQGSLPIWKLDRFGCSLVDCLNNIRFLEGHGIRFVAVTQALDTDIQNPASRLLLHVLGAATEFERSLIRERAKAGRLRYQLDYNAGRVGKTVYSKSRKNLPVGRPKRIFNRLLLGGHVHQQIWGLRSAPERNLHRLSQH